MRGEKDEVEERGAVAENLPRRHGERGNGEKTNHTAETRSTEKDRVIW